jgi:hypothetical protein
MRHEIAGVTTIYSITRDIILFSNKKVFFIKGRKGPVPARYADSLVLEEVVSEEAQEVGSA